jgi:nitroreductase
MSLKSQLKAFLQSKPAVWNSYWRLKQELLRLWMLRFFLYDIANTYRAMYWVPGSRAYRTLCASLLFQYHKLEKGLVMPGPRRLFGVEPATAVIQHLERWHAAGHSRQDPVYLGALETLQAFHAHLQRHALDPKGQIEPRVGRFLAEHPLRRPDLVTPQPLANLQASDSPYAAFRSLAQHRRSVREFLPDPVPEAVLAQAVALAQLSPSACNRQPCRVYALRDEAVKKAALALQNGNRGFGHLAPQVLIITADEAGFFDASERHQPYIDGGLFAMSLTLALSSQGVASCCLNWCVPPANDRAAHRLLNIPTSERIVMFMAIGHAPADCRVPQSPRRELGQVLAEPAIQR